MSGRPLDPRLGAAATARGPRPDPLPAADEPEDPRADLRWGTIPRLVREAAGRLGGREALVDGDRRLTYAQLGSEVERFAAALMAAGVAAGDRVAIWAPNCAEWAIGALGASSAGAVLVPLNTRFKGAEAAYILRASGAEVLLTVRGFLGLDFPALLAGHDTGALRQLVVLRGDGSPPPGSPPPGASPGGVAVVGLAELLEGAGSVDRADVVARAEAVAADGVSDLVFTSGTTGSPKGAMATHAQSLRTFGTWASIVGLAEGDRYLVVNPFFHTFGYKAGLLASLMAGATVLPEAAFDAGAVLERVAAERVTVLPGPPTLYQSLLSHPDRTEHDLSSLRLGVTGAAVVPFELVAAMRHQLGFSTVLTAYGLTESCGTVTMCRRTDPVEVVAATSGRAIPGLEVRVVPVGGPEGPAAEGPAAEGPAAEGPAAEGPAAEGAAGAEGPVPRGQPGEIVVRGYTVMRGYWDDPAGTAEAVDADGWLHTGDIGVMDVGGNVTVTDRLKDMFVVGGFNAYPAEIEAMLRGCPDVAQVAVAGVADPRLGEVGCAWVVPPVPSGSAAGAGGGPDRAARAALGRRVLAWSREAMANYKAPRVVVVVDELPLNAAGKVLKRRLRERFAAGQEVGEVVTSERKR